MRDLHELPKFRDGLSYLYVEHCKIEQDKLAIALFDTEGKISVPCANLALLMIGPGTSITHAAIRVLAENGCLVVWCGEEGIRFYAQGMGETRSSKKIIHQANLVSNSLTRLAIVKKMYQMRFKDDVDKNLSIEQLRGREGARVKDTYMRESKKTGIPWKGRIYKQKDWSASDPVNKTLSTANSCLYGLCHSAIVSIGYSPAIGFIHTGKQLSFVYDIADLYKADITIPIAFQIVQESDLDIERRTRVTCRDKFKEFRLLPQIIDDIEKIFDIENQNSDENELNRNIDLDSEIATPGGLWDPTISEVRGGKNFDPSLNKE